MARKVLVTGGHGFIGSKLESSVDLEYFKIGSEVNLLDPDGINRAVFLAIENNCDSILHLAWTSNSNKNYEHDLENLNWYSKTVEFAEVAINNNLFFLSTGTGAELDRYNNSIYVQSKRLTKSKLFKLLPANYVTWIKIFYVIDIIGKRPRIIDEIFKSHGIKLISHGNTLNDYIFIEDVISGFNYLLRNKIIGEIDLGSGFLTSNYDLVQKICHLYKIQLPIIENKSNFNGKKADVDKLIKLGWYPSRTTEFFQEK